MNKILLALSALVTGMSLTALAADTAPPAPLLPPAVPVVVAATETNEAAPKIQFATPIYNFGRVKAGEPVKFDYVFTNVGNALLELTAVQPGCGCTTAGEWSRKVGPGQIGHIPIQFNAGGYSGPVTKGITVTCNDKTQPTVALQITGTIWKPVDVIPQYAMLNGTAEVLANATSVVRIVNNEEPPLTLEAPEINNPMFVAEVKTKEEGKEYEVVVRLAKTLESGNANGIISFKSSSTNMPTLTINTVAILQPTFVATPPAVNLPVAPTTNAVPVTVSIRNQSNRQVKLSEPAVNGKGVEVQMQEPEPGRLYTLTLTFPSGYEIGQGEKVELTVKTDHPMFPTFKVPVMQPRRAAL